MKPFPSKSNALSRILEHGLVFNSIIDIGVRECTSELINYFPHAKHYLYEPVSFYFDTIHKNYAQIDYELNQVALSDKSGTCYQVCTCIDGSGNPTHSQVSDQPAIVDGKIVISSDTVQMSRLDDILNFEKIAGPTLFKIDVDGHELPILHGATKSLEYVSLVIIETTCQEMTKRACFLEEHGFNLIEIVDLCYFCNTLSQFDMIFVKKDILTQNRKFSPWGVIPFSSDKWFPLFNI
jgi:FkbM family methyltransferase